MLFRLHQGIRIPYHGRQALSVDLIGLGQMLHITNWEEHLPIFDILKELAESENSLFRPHSDRPVISDEWAHEIQLEAEKKALSALLAVASAYPTW